MTCPSTRLAPFSFVALLAFAALLVLGCDNKVGPGSRCFTDADCASDTGCFLLEGTGDIGSESVCLRYCDASAVYCENGEVCAPSEDDPARYVCLLGGPVQTGDQCDYAWQCERGSICVLAGVGSDYCFPACDISVPSTCGIDSMGAAIACVDLDPCDDTRDVGYCTTTPPTPPVCPGADAGAPDAGTSDSGTSDAGAP